MEIVLVRHAQPDWEPNDRAVDDPGLTPLGQQQAESVAKHLAGDHTILGSCDGEATLRKLEQAVLRGEPATIDTVEVTRG